MKKFLIAWVGGFLMVCMVNWNSGVEAAEKYPAKPVSLIVPLDAGGGLDVSIRPFGETLGKVLGQPVVIVNKPGAGSSIGYRATHDVKPDGYTIGAGMATLVANKVQGLLPYDYHDFTMLGNILAPTPVLLASTKSKRTFKTFKELIEFAKSHPEDVLMAAGGKGQGWWNVAKDLETVTGVRFNLVPQVGSGGSSMAQVAGGHVEVGIVSLNEGRSQIEAGNAILLAVAAPIKRRTPMYPNVPTVNELGYNLRYYSTAFMMGPPNMPKEITEILIKSIETAAKDPDFLKILEEKTFGTPLYMNPEETMKLLNDQREIIRDIMGKAGLLKEK